MFFVFYPDIYQIGLGTVFLKHIILIYSYTFCYSCNVKIYPQFSLSSQYIAFFNEILWYLSNCIRYFFFQTYNFYKYLYMFFFLIWYLSNCIRYCFFKHVNFINSYTGVLIHLSSCITYCFYSVSFGSREPT